MCHEVDGNGWRAQPEAPRTTGLPSVWGTSLVRKWSGVRDPGEERPSELTRRAIRVPRKAEEALHFRATCQSHPESLGCLLHTMRDGDSSSVYFVTLSAAEVLDVENIANANMGVILPWIPRQINFRNIAGQHICPPPHPLSENIWKYLKHRTSTLISKLAWEMINKKTALVSKQNPQKMNKFSYVI